MNKYLKTYLTRGMMFAGFGPLVFGVVIMCIGFNEKINLEGWQILLGIASTYLLAFIVAGSSVFEQIEEWSSVKIIFAHMFSIYFAYLFTYLINSWIPLNWTVILIFSSSILITFLLIWFSVFLLTNKTKNQLNSKLKNKE